jgi:hypothetical protein
MTIARTRRLLVGAPLLVLAAFLFATTAEVSYAQSCTTNEIVCENAKPGADPETWQINQWGDPSIQGFATSMSVNKGQTISFKVDSDTPNFTIDILRLGYYGGDGARLIANDLTPTGPSNQPACQTFADTGLIDCGNWSVTRSWTVPSDAVSGVYIAYLRRNDTGGDSHIVFVVRDDASDSDIVLQTSDQTWQAYNKWGGNSLYDCADVCPPGSPKGYKAAYEVSYNRPMNTEAESPGSALFNGSEYSLIRFLERNGYDVSYISGLDTLRRGPLLLSHNLFLSSGHDEYWAAGQRANVKAARDAGVNLGFFAGNLMFWKTRFAPSRAGTATPDRTLVSYKDTHFEQQQDPVEWTGTWRDPRMTTLAQLEPENALTGLSFEINSGTTRITVPSTYKNLRTWRNTDVVSLASGQSLTLAPKTLGYEWDIDVDNGFRPAGQFRLSSTTASGVERFLDFGSTTAFGQTATHNMVMYRAASGARVFNSGTVQWAWGLDGWNEDDAPADRNMQQATVNLFADMGAIPATRMSSLAAATPTTDAARPTSTITSAPTTIADGTTVTVSGTAGDSGGVVAGVEISTDGGTTWHPATGTTSWSYSWVAHGAPTTTLKTRAVDDSGNLEIPGAGRTVTVTCPCSIWGNGFAPPSGDIDSGDPTPLELGVKFKADVYGTITGVRFYKAAANTGTHVGSLWTASGDLLGRATFSGETASGWQSVTFSDPVTVQPGVTYVASYHAPNGHYSASADYFWRAPAPGPSGGGVVANPPLRTVSNDASTLNGLYSYAPTSSFPTNSYSAGNYWVDVNFAPIPAPGTATGVTAAAGGLTKANVSWTAPSSGGAPQTYEVVPYVGSTAQTALTKTVNAPTATTTVTGLTTGTTYTFRVRAVNPAGSGPLSSASNSVTPTSAVVPSQPTNVAAQGASNSAKVTWTPSESDGDSAITRYDVTPYIGTAAQPSVQAAATASSVTIPDLTNGTAYTFRVTATNGVGTSAASAASNAVTPQATIFDFAIPATPDAGDPLPVELGVKFKADTDGSITGIRFYKSAANVGTHVGTLWSAAGAQLARATFANESASGWQSVTFSTPVQVTAGTTYIASYHAPSGHYAATGGFAGGVDNPPLHTIPNETSTNGVYVYSSAPAFPTSSWNATNYWVDVLYAVPAPGTPTSASATENGSTSARVSWTPPASGGPASSYRITPYVGAAAQTPKTVTAPASSAVVGGLTSGTSYTFDVRAVNANGAGPASNRTNAVTPTVAVVPPAPTGVSAQPATESARVTWTAPASDGDSPITGYTVTPYVGTTAGTPVQVAAGQTATTITGLDNGTAYMFRVKATNGVGSSLESAATSAVTPRATIFDFATPGTVDSGDGDSLEVGVKFRTDFPGTITGVRFYKAAANTGTHIGSLWTAAGDPLTQVTFTNETAGGWQTVMFASPVTVSANTTYVASYFAPKGHYSVNSGAFGSPITNGPLTALETSVSSNGVYAYSASRTFPTSTFGASNYWVDVLYEPAAAPGAPTNVSATAGQASATVSWTAPTTGGPVSSYRITPYIGSTAQTPTTVSAPATSAAISGLTAGTSYTFRVRGINPSGDGAESAASNAVTPTGAQPPSVPRNVIAEGDSKAAIVKWDAPSSNGGSALTGYTVTPFAGSTAGTSVDVGASATNVRVTGLTNGTAYTFQVVATNGAGSSPVAATDAVTPRASLFEGATPSVVDAGDTSAVNLGVKFTATVNGSVTGLRFYKATANTGTHVGTLWNADGTQVREATFTRETVSGWQAVTFATPAPVTAGTTYVASYHAPNGHYSSTSAAFSNPIENPPLQALANSVSNNGVYAYNASPVFPTGSWNASNYWVDILFAPGS